VGPEPDVVLAYNSASVDGRTSTSNNQPSWVGEGFDLTMGFVERQYGSCRDEGLTSGDLCWGPDRVSLVLAGHSTDLIKDSATGAWVPLDDDGTRVSVGTGAGNGDAEGEYWLVTTHRRHPLLLRHPDPWHR
jgi:hypothetical protein